MQKEWATANHKGRPHRWAGASARPHNGGHGQNARWRNRAGAENGRRLSFGLAFLPLCRMKLDKEDEASRGGGGAMGVGSGI
jgi:hypothetical protein